jgi:hypothetical protein
MAAEKLVKIKMLRGVTGSDLTGRPFTASAGSEVEVPEDFALDLTRGGFHAELVGPIKETATAKHQNKETR